MVENGAQYCNISGFLKSLIWPALDQYFKPELNSGNCRMQYIDVQMDLSKLWTISKGIQT